MPLRASPHGLGRPGGRTMRNPDRVFDGSISTYSAIFCSFAGPMAKCSAAACMSANPGTPQDRCRTSRVAEIPSKLLEVTLLSIYPVPLRVRGMLRKGTHGGEERHDFPFGYR